MKFRLLVAGWFAVVSVVLVSGQSAKSQEPAAPVTPPAAAAPASTLPQVVTSASDERALINRYCVGCHNQRAKGSSGPAAEASRKLALDQLDTSRVQENAESWERVVRKLRAGMMPPVTSRRPEPATYKSMITWLENELDRGAAPHMPPPGLHRLNRTEYANAIRDLLELDIDPAKYLPSDDSTHGFDNMAGALGISSTLVEAYVAAAGKISRLAIGETTSPTLVVYRTPEDTSQDYHIEGLPFGTRGGMLIEHVFPSDGEYTVTITPIFGDNMSPTGFGSVPCEKLEISLDGARLALVDWQGSRRFGVPPPNCSGRRGGPGAGASAGAGGSATAPSSDQAAQAPAAGAPSGQTQAARGGQGAGGFGRNQIPKMTVRLKTTAGSHKLGVT